MTVAPVGLRCPEHATQRPRPVRPSVGARTGSGLGLGIRVSGRTPIVTQTLIAINVLVYLIQLGMGASVNADRGWIFIHGVLFGPFVADGDWWRLITAAFLHHGPLHLGLNMLALWWFGAPVELYLGRGRFLLVYLVSGLAGSAGALLVTPTSPTVGASGAIFGILGAALVLERQRINVLGGSALTVIIVNLAFTLFVPGISIGGHLGGLAGGALATLALSNFGRAHPVYGRPGLPGIIGVIVVGAVSVLVSYWKVRGIA